MKQAFSASEAGVQDAVGRLIAGTIVDAGQADPSWNSGNVYSSPTADFTNSFTLTHLLSNGAVVYDPGGLPYYVIQSTGYDGPAQGTQKTIRAVVSMRTSNVFNSAMTGCSGITAAGRASVDSYDEAKGSYNAPLVSGGNNVGSDGSLTTCNAGANISLGGDINIAGNVAATGTVTTSGNPTVSGTIKDGAPTSACDPVGVASVVASVEGGGPSPGSMSSISLSGHDTMTLTGPGAYYYSGISMSANTVLTVGGSGDVTIFVGDGGFSMTAQSLFTINANVRLTLYATGPISFTGQDVTNYGPPSHLMVYSSNTGSQAVSLAGGSDFAGGIYAPLGTVSLSGNAVYYGAVRGRSIADSGTNQFHYDEALGRMPVPNSYRGYTMVNWKEVFN